jgi:hypothetical protein
MLTNDFGLQDQCSRARSWLSLASDRLSLRRLSIAIANWIRSSGQVDFVDIAVLVENDSGLGGGGAV